MQLLQYRFYEIRVAVFEVFFRIIISIMFVAVLLSAGHIFFPMKDKLVILLVDDDEDDHHIFNMAVQNACLNCQMYNALNAEQATLIIKSITPDFVFVDMHMPRVNGIQFYQL